MNEGNSSLRSAMRWMMPLPPWASCDSKTRRPDRTLPRLRWTLRDAASACLGFVRVDGPDSLATKVIVLAARHDVHATCAPSTPRTPRVRGQPEGYGRTWRWLRRELLWESRSGRGYRPRGVTMSANRKLLVTRARVTKVGAAHHPLRYPRRQEWSRTTTRGLARRSPVFGGALVWPT